LQEEYEVEMAPKMISPNKILVKLAWWVRFAPPNENWALRRVLAM
jgi:hypothetical protein